MTALQLAKAECPNCDNDKCLRVNIKDDLTHAIMPGGKDCDLSRGVQCQYFERCILPLENISVDKKIVEVCRNYRLANNILPETEKRKCPDCGSILLPRKRYCPACAEHRRELSTAAAVSKHRAAVSS